MVCYMLEAASIEAEARNPIILPKKAHAVDQSACKTLPREGGTFWKRACSELDS